MKFKLFNIDFEVTFLFAALIAFVIATNSPFNVLATILSSLLHETGHLVMMYCSDNLPQCVRFEITGMNIKRQPSVKISTKNEIFIALAGPLANAMVLFISCIILCFLQSEKIFTIASVNLILTTFNLLPVKRLDGGMALYFWLSKKYDNHICSKILNITSIIFIILIYIWGIYVFVSTNYNITVLIIAIFLTLSMFSGNEY